MDITLLYISDWNKKETKPLKLFKDILIKVKKLFWTPEIEYLLAVLN